MGEVKQNSFKAWILAARPKTLTGAAAPVFVGWALALFYFNRIEPDQGVLNWTNAIICLLFALLMQIDANFINDYFDFKKGSDTKERLGPERACAQGWITLKAMRLGIFLITLLAVLVGVPLIIQKEWWLVIVGLACVIGAFLYTTHLSYRGWGDVMVLFFFGLILVFFTQWVTLNTTLANSRNLPYIISVILAGAAMGFVTDNLLVVNNYRDREQDAQNGKKTIIVRLGARAGERLYLFNGILGIVLAIAAEALLAVNYGGYFWPIALVLLFLPLLITSYCRMVKIKSGKALNFSLGGAARNILIFSVFLVSSITLLFFSFEDLL